VIFMNLPVSIFQTASQGTCSLIKIEKKKKCKLQISEFFSSCCEQLGWIQD
jgi:hypothetical protein